MNRLRLAAPRRVAAERQDRRAELGALGGHAARARHGVSRDAPQIRGQARHAGRAGGRRGRMPRRDRARSRGGGRDHPRRRPVGERGDAARQASGRDRQKAVARAQVALAAPHARQQRTGPARLAAPGDDACPPTTTSISTSTGSMASRCFPRPPRVEIAAEAVATVWPGWEVAEVSDLRLLSGFKLEDDRPRVLEISGARRRAWRRHRLQRLGGAALGGRGRPAALPRLASASATRCPASRRRAGRYPSSRRGAAQRARGLSRPALPRTAASRR